MLIKATQLLRAALRDRSGVSSLEYAILAVGIVGALGAAMVALVPDINALWLALENAITNATL
jgi:Flp pilus assembly pilin Flp